ncbi:MAG: phytanoyl-CoA dioxygenase family protein [Saprospiraceae bacterium]
MEKIRLYGSHSVNELSSQAAICAESLAIKGFAVLETDFDAATLGAMSGKLDELNRAQDAHFGRDTLEKIKEADMVRCPLAHDDLFLQVATKPELLEVVEAMLGNYFILHLQNAIINRPNLVHHQTSWHRDLPYQEWTSSRPMALGALFCVDKFTVENGATFVLPHSHRIDLLPSLNYLENNQIQVEAKPGSYILFDAMLFHRAGTNRSDYVRRGINNVFSRPILKQQLDLPRMLGDRFASDPFLSKLLGYDSQVLDSDAAFKGRRLKKQ